MSTENAMKPRVKLSAFVERLRGSLWFLPAVSAITAIVVGSWLSTVEVADDDLLQTVVFTGGPEGARGVLQAVATSVITVTSLVFTLTVVALQLASTQFSPRLLRTFLRLPANQVVLSTFIATFVYSLVVLKSIRSEPAFVPALAVALAFALVLMSVGALVYFINHITTEIRIDTLMWRVEQDTLETIDGVYPDHRADDGRPADAPDRPEDALAVRSTRSGIVQAIAAEPLVKIAGGQGLTIALAPIVGERVVADGVLAWVWAAGDAAQMRDLAEVARDVNRAVTIGHERTMQQDLSYGIRQLVDIAVKAMSPGINDPTTAVDATGHLTSVMTVLVRRRVEPLVARDDAGVVRLVLDRPSYDGYLDKAISQIRRYGAGEPEVLLALLNLCREVAEATPDGRYDAALRRHVELLATAARRSVDDASDLAGVEGAAANVRGVIDDRRRSDPSATRPRSPS